MALTRAGHAHLGLRRVHPRDDRLHGLSCLIHGTAGRCLCGMRFGHGHRPRREWPYYRVRGSCQRGHRELTARPSTKNSTTFSARSNVAVRGWLRLRLLLLLGYHVGCSTQAPGVILCARKVGEERSEGRAREDILWWTRERIVPTVGAMMPMIVGRIVGGRTRELCLVRARTGRWSRATPTAAVMAAVMPLGATRTTGADRFSVIAGIEIGRIVESAGIVHRHQLRWNDRGSGSTPSPRCGGSTSAGTGTSRYHWCRNLHLGSDSIGVNGAHGDS
jgi:hypothetical protein